MMYCGWGQGVGGYKSLQIVRLEIKDEREDRDSAHASLRFKKKLLYVITFHIKKIVNGVLETPPTPHVQPKHNTATHLF